MDRPLCDKCQITPAVCSVPDANLCANCYLQSGNAFQHSRDADIRNFVAEYLEAEANRLPLKKSARAEELRKAANIYRGVC